MKANAKTRNKENRKGDPVFRVFLFSCFRDNYISL
jgi:hypothetical protein